MLPSRPSSSRYSFDTKMTPLLFLQTNPLGGETSPADHDMLLEGRPGPEAHYYNYWYYPSSSGLTWLTVVCFIYEEMNWRDKITNNFFGYNKNNLILAIGKLKESLSIFQA